MMKYIKYFKYIIRHKWFVFMAIVNMPDHPDFSFYPNIIWSAIMHDISKFLPSEFIPYANFFYGKGSPKQNGLKVNKIQDIDKQNKFDIAWLKHIHRNPHYWQHWILRADGGFTKALDIPDKYIMEMVCDWQSASRAIRGKGATALEWYKNQWDRIMLTPETREKVEKLLNV